MRLIKCHSIIWLVAFAACLLSTAPNYGPRLLVESAKTDAKAADKKTDTATTTTDQPEPPFPRLLLATKFDGKANPRRIKLVTEILDDKLKRTSEEYFDMDLRRAAYTFTKTETVGPSGAIEKLAQPYREVMLSHASLGQIFIYHPYVCSSLPMNHPKFQGLDHYTVTIKYNNQNIQDKTKVPTLRVFGAIAMWSYASSHPTSYALVKRVYSAQKDVYMDGHQWTVSSQEHDVDIRFLFIETSINDGTKEKKKLLLEGERMELESIQLVSHSDGNILRTINVLSIDYDLDLDAYDSVFEVPLGYGCIVNSDEKSLKQWDARGTITWLGSRAELEVSATKIDPTNGTRSSDTMTVEMAHTGEVLGGLVFDLAMTKVKSHDKETKTVSNYMFNVKYTIDLQKGTCTLSHLANENTRPADEPYTYQEDPDSEFLLKFANGLKLSLERDQFKYLFANSEGYLIMKETKTVLNSGEELVYTYLERTINSWPYGTKQSAGSERKFARQVKTFVTKKSANIIYKSMTSKLVSMTIWVMTGNVDVGTKIESIYQINVIDIENNAKKERDVRRLMDVSQECYLDNDDMRSGLDYAWVEFFYPAASRDLDLVMNNMDFIKGQLYIYLRSTSGLVSSFQVPRFELMFSDEGLVVRALFLDIPSLDLIYEPFDGTAIHLDKKQGDLMFITPDIKHCSKLCHQYSCKSMTFCMGPRSCLLGTRATFSKETSLTTKSGDTNAVQLQPFEPTEGCVTYSANGGAKESLLKMVASFSLNRLLARFKHHDYVMEGIPKPPESLLSPIEEGDNPSHVGPYNYLKELQDYFAREDTDLPLMRFIGFIDLQLIVLMPSSFIVEDDPFDKFDTESTVGSRDEQGNLVQPSDELLHDDSKVVEYFHEGLSISRYKYNAFQSSQHKDKARLVSGISYDQCALGCLDSKCGTFSYCPGRKECIITTFSLIAEGLKERLVEEDGECFISQRDFTKNYQKFTNTGRPKAALSGIVAASVNDCALGCMQHDGKLECLSFTFCHNIATSLQTQVSNCYFQHARHPIHLFNDNNVNTPKSVEGEPEPEADICDHYERSYLAEFNQIESTQFSGEMLDKLVGTTSEYTGKTTLECADICLNQLNDCSAFQFCVNYSGGSNKMQACLMIEGKLAQTANANDPNELEVVIDSDKHDEDALVRKSKFLKYNYNCQVFALRPNTAQAHLRDLAMGNTMTVKQKQEIEQSADKSTFGGYQMSWLRYAFIFMSVTLTGALISLSVCWAYQRDERVRDQIDRVWYRIALL